MQFFIARCGSEPNTLGHLLLPPWCRLFHTTVTVEGASNSSFHHSGECLPLVPTCRDMVCACFCNLVRVSSHQFFLNFSKIFVRSLSTKSSRDRQSDMFVSLGCATDFKPEIIIQDLIKSKIPQEPGTCRATASQGPRGLSVLHPSPTSACLSRSRRGHT